MERGRKSPVREVPGGNGVRQGQLDNLRQNGRVQERATVLRLLRPSKLETTRRAEKAQVDGGRERAHPELRLLHDILEGVSTGILSRAQFEPTQEPVSAPQVYEFGGKFSQQ